MPGQVSQALAQGQPAPGFAQSQVSGNLGLVNYGLQAATFTALKNGSYLVPTGGTVTLPTPTGSGAFIALTIFGTGVTTLSGIVSSAGATLSSFIVQGDQTLIIGDADPTRGWC